MQGLGCLEVLKDFLPTELIQTKGIHLILYHKYLYISYMNAKSL